MSAPRVALWGAGMISGAHAVAAGALQLPITAVASRSVERATEQAERLHTVAARYEDLPGDADIVIVATPPQLHAEHALHLLAAGAAVVLEKPLCTTLADADRLVTAAAEHGERVLYAENLAYAPVMTTLIRMAAAMGPATSLEVRMLQSKPTWGAFTTDEWGGGALFDLGVHPLALAVLAAAAGGAGPATSVRATLRGGEGHNSDEHADVHITFRSGLVGHVEASWQHGPERTWDVQLSSATSVLRADFWPHPTLERNGDPVALPPATLPPMTPPLAFVEELGYLGQLGSFVDDVDHGRTPFMDVVFGRLILDIACAAYSSAGAGGTPEPLPFAGRRDRTPLQLWHGDMG